MKVIEISALSFNKNYFKFRKDIKNCLDNEIKHLHYDVMDDVFVPNTSFSKLEKLDYLIKKGFSISVHLMVENVENYLKKLVYKNVDIITFHCESQDVEKGIELIRFIRSKNIKAGIAIKPKTNLKDYETLIKMSDVITLMSVEPGFGGQKYIENSEKRALEIKKIANKKNIIIQIDGGINRETMMLAKNNCEYFVSGSFLYKNMNKYKEFMDELNK